VSESPYGTSAAKQIETSPGGSVPPPQPWTATTILIVVMAVIGFAFDTYVLLVMPLINRPALAELLQVDRYTEAGSQAILNWSSYITWSSAVCGGVFGLLGGWLTDRFGRRTVLTWSILLFAVSALLSGFSTSALMLLVLRCTTFIGVCVEFVAAVAWLAELFPNPQQRERVLGYTQAFSSFGGMMATGSYLLVNLWLNYLPPLVGESEPHAWRYTLISGVIPALPLIFIRPFLPESPVWLQRRLAGTLRRPSIFDLFRAGYLRTSLVTGLLFACAFATAFGALQLTPQMIPGLFPAIGKERISNLVPYEAAKSPEKLTALEKKAEQASEAAEKAAKGDDPAKAEEAKKAAGIARKQVATALAAKDDPAKLEELRGRVAAATQEMEGTIGGIQMYQEIGGLVGRFVLAFLATVIVSRRLLLWLFQVPGLILIPLVYFFPAAGLLFPGHPELNAEWLKAGVFVAGFLTIAQFSFWGNYLPRVYPTHLRGTGESFAANVGGRMLGTSGQFLAAILAPVMLAHWPSLGNFGKIAYAAGTVVVIVYALGIILTYFLPQPKEEVAQE
jgi:MFS family permease